MFCPKCGYANGDDEQLCGRCRTDLKTGKVTIGEVSKQQKVMALLCYFVGWMSGIFFLLMEKDSYIRFHAIQSVGLFVPLSVLTGILQSVAVPTGMKMGTDIPMSGAMVAWSLVTLLSLVLWVLLMVKAYQGKMFKLPIIGNIAEKHS